MDSAYLSLGERIGMYRRRRGLSQLRLGGLIDRSEDWVSKVERGEIPIDRIPVLVKAAAALHVGLADLLGDPSLRAGDRGTDVPGVEALRSTIQLLAFTTAAQPRKLDVVTGDLDAAYELWNAVRLTDLVAVLPNLLTELHALSADGEAAVTSELISAYGLAGKTLSRLGEGHLAHLVADRAVALAERTGPVDQALAAFRMSHVLLGMARLDDAIRVAEVGVARARPHMADDRVRCLAGAMHLPAAVAAARQGDRSGVHQALEEATARTRSGDRVAVPADLARVTQYGPTNVAIHKVSAAVDLGDAGDAIREAEHVTLGAVSVSRASRHLIDVGLAHSHRRNTDGMLAALLQAEELAPEQVHYFPVAREMVHGALRRERGHANRRLHALADRVGVA